MRNPYQQKMFFLKMKDQQYKTGKRVVPVKYDYENMPLSNFNQYPSDRSIEILNDILEVFQEFYGITIDELIVEKRAHWEAILRAHLFWLVRFYRQWSKFDQEPFDVTDSFVTSMFARRHPMAGHGERAIDMLLEADFNFRKSHDELFDLMENKLRKYKMGKLI